MEDKKAELMAKVEFQRPVAKVVDFKPEFLSGRVKDYPLRLVVYGQPGVGKSTFAALSENPVFFDFEKGSRELDVTRFSNATNYDTLMASIAWLKKENHSFKTVVIDTLDSLESIIHREIIDKHKWQAISDGAWAEGYSEALAKFRNLIFELDELAIKRDMSQILIAHCKVVVTSSPDEINPYEKLGLKLNDRVVGLLREKCDAIGLAKRETIATKDQSSGKYKAYYTGKHHLLTAPSAHYESKSRFILPDPLPLVWNDFKTAFLERETGAAEEIYAKILVEAEKVTDASMKAKILTTVERDKTNPRQLIKHFNLLNERLAKKENS